MRLATLRRSRSAPPLPGLHGVARVAPPARSGTDLDGLLRHVRRGDIAVIEHLDLDAGTARALVRAGFAAVVNAAPSLSGRYPALGAQVLVEHGVVLLDRVGPEVLRLVDDGDRLRLDGSTLYRGEEVLAHGDLLDAASVALLVERARRGLAVQLEAFAGNTAEFLRHEGDLFLDGEGVPEVRTALAGRPVVVVCGGHGWQDDLRALRPWMRHADPVVVGVDEGGEAALVAGLTPDLLVGNPELMTEDALLCGAEVVVRGERGGRAPGLDRADALGAATVVFPVAAGSEDAALLLLDAADPSLVVMVGSRLSVTDFVDRVRADLAGTFLTRLKVGTRLVDASTVAAVYRPPSPVWPLWLLAVLLLAGVAAVLTLAGDASPVGQWREGVLDDVVRLWDART